MAFVPVRFLVVWIMVWWFMIIIIVVVVAAVVAPCQYSSKPCRPDLATSDYWPTIGQSRDTRLGTMASRELEHSSVLPFDWEIDSIPWQIGQNWRVGTSVGASFPPLPCWALVGLE